MSELKNWSQQEIAACVQACKERAEKDAAFRELLSSDPAKAIKEVTGKDFPVDHFKELSEAELETAVGGGVLPGETWREIIKSIKDLFS